jgi:hypothetical protein
MAVFLFLLSFFNAYDGRLVGKEEERAMFQQMQAMAQKQVNINQIFYTPKFFWFSLFLIF